MRVMALPRRTLAAPVVTAAYYASGFGWRAWRQWRATGDHGLRLHHSDGVQLLAGGLLLGGAVGAVVAAMQEPADDGPAYRAGIGVMLAAIAGTALAQSDMGRSWRVGVDQGESTELVTTGLFRFVRNPIFTAMGAFAGGLVLAQRTPTAACAAVTLGTAMHLQVTQVEEPYLRRTHGSAYEEYAQRVGRYLPKLQPARAAISAA